MNDEKVIYLDSSALVKLVTQESESSALKRFLNKWPLHVSCGLARVEVVRAVRLDGPVAVRRARRLLDRINLVRLDDELLDTAGSMDCGIIRSLDAIHLSAAQLLGTSLAAIVTYDRQMITAAEKIGITVASPAAVIAPKNLAQ